MSQSSIDAVYENGAFRPVDPLPVKMREGDHVRLRLEDPATTTSLDLAYQVYDGLTADEIAEVERVALDRSRFFDTEESTE